MRPGSRAPQEVEKQGPGGGMPREQANGGTAAGGGGVMRRGTRMAGVGPGEIMRDAST